ncbi:sigma-70 family RNA polymerase sigma factor [Paenibacillus sp. PR3]|uniref:Sigma-70 family RNA polymerase sigma factor n=1 Tax=Paenibacillus terricola TaxID=2763503 RepID=A0ABR8MZD5_9BACL|nr:hypothetical protein [Paenibacillus terricola]MBD3921313.1 sigma-70 family RNA polymerase sigma factor [Paenibacillus terricola]
MMDTEVEASAIAYVKLCLKGRASRLKKRWSLISNRENLTHDTISFETLGVTTNQESFDDLVADKVIIEQGIIGLTSNEKRVITELYWNSKKVIDLCNELNVSKNTILKTKRNALEKLRRRIYL